MWDILVGKVHYRHICSFSEFALLGVCLGFVGGVGDFYIGILEEVCDVPCFSSHIRKHGPFRFSVDLFLFFPFL